MLVHLVLVATLRLVDVREAIIIWYTISFVMLCYRLSVLPFVLTARIGPVVCSAQVVSSVQSCPDCRMDRIMNPVVPIHEATIVSIEHVLLLGKLRRCCIFRPTTGRPYVHHMANRLVPLIP